MLLYLLTHDGYSVNFTGCGNTINGNHPGMRTLIINCLRSWVSNYHIDGFRFDLASILSRDRRGNLVRNTPVLERIAEDPILSQTKIIAEAWDAAGAYQLGSFGAGRWAEWNGKYRDDVRAFWRGDEGKLGVFATRLCGSSDLYRKLDQNPSNSVNFITAHDGFTMNDLVTYNHKHNYANGEGNRDGDNNNLSYNYGVEGETKDERVNELRSRQVRNFFCSLMLSRGVPMIVAGDEGRRTQKGNNNAYCQDSPISWLDWDRLRAHDDLRRFVAALIKFRRHEASLRRRDFFTGQPQFPGGLPDVSWFDRAGGSVNWNDPNVKSLVSLICALDPLKDPRFAQEIAEARALVSLSFPFDATIEAAPEARFHILAMFNASHKPQMFYFLAVAKLERFCLASLCRHGGASPSDIYPNYDGPAPDATALYFPERSMRVYPAERE